jgi:hypothetical protein
MNLINDKKPFYLRYSSLQCVQCFLYSNEEQKADIIANFFFQPSSQVNAGQFLCSGLFNQKDFVSSWLCATALAHVISDNKHLKEQLLRVSLIIKKNNISLLQNCMSIIMQREPLNHDVHSRNLEVENCAKFQSVVSLFVLMSFWLCGCPQSVDIFLSQQQNIPYVNFVLNDNY